MGMEPDLPDTVICVKGLIPYCLEESSKGWGARARLRKLQQAIAALAPSYQGLEATFDKLLVSRLFSDENFRRNAREYLRAHWFDATSPNTHFPGQNVAKIYAEGVLKALELSLNGRRIRWWRRTIPISAWWIVDAPDVKLLTMADVDKAGTTIGGQVTLLILTPRPIPTPRLQAQAPIRRTLILGDVAEAWISQAEGDDTVTRRVRNLAANA